MRQRRNRHRCAKREPDTVPGLARLTLNDILRHNVFFLCGTEQMVHAARGVLWEWEFYQGQLRSSFCWPKHFSFSVVCSAKRSNGEATPGPCGPRGFERIRPMMARGLKYAMS